ncbi:MAG: lysophospholipid acyltransferase family protein, partial [Candidatus Sumerlaeia bacterium]
MQKFILVGCNLIYAFCLLLLVVLFVLYIPFHFLIYGLFSRHDLPEIGRMLNYLFGRYITRLSWPMIRVHVKGRENVPGDGSFVCVANHRSFTDIFFCSWLPRPETNVVLRSWPFRLPVLGLFMRLGGYYDIEKDHIDVIMEKSKRLIDKNIGLMFFPEGHRSRDGHLHHFRSGAFKLAVHHNIPVVPMVLEGTENLGIGLQWFRPTRVDITFLPCVYPGDFDTEKRALRLRREVQHRFREALGEIADKDPSDQSPQDPLILQAAEP